MSEAAQHRKSLWWRALVFAGVVVLFFYALFAATMPKYAEVSTLEEIAKADLSQEYVLLSPSIAKVYPGRLCEPADFAGATSVAENSTKGLSEDIPRDSTGEPSENPVGDPAGNSANNSAGDPEAKFQTYRIVLPLKANITYGISGQTATYAQKVWVNGELLSEVGTVSDTPENFNPKTDTYEIFFTPTTDKTEIIVQHAWFNHAHGAFHKIYLAEQQVITTMNRQQTMCDGLVVGSLLAMAIFFFGMYLFNLSNRGMLWFSLSSLCAAANFLIYESKQIMVFFPELNWYIGHKIELLTNIYYFFFIVLFAYATLKELPPKWASALGLSTAGAATLFYVIAPSTVYSYYTVPIGAFMMVCELIISIDLLRTSIRKKRYRQADEMIVTLAPLLTLLVYIIEGITYFQYVFYLRAYLMILLAFCCALALAIGHTRTERNLLLAQMRELEIGEENAALEQLSRLKSDFMRNMAHEMKTPLTVMSGYAQLTEREIQKDSVNDETVENLETIAREAGRLSDMVTQLLDITYQQTTEKEKSILAPAELLEDAGAVCRPILQKNSNRLELSCRASQKISANKEALLQVIINLCINSNKHTTNDVISISVTDTEDSMVAFAVHDNGSGINSEDLPYIFERGFSQDGSTGLGLTICREIIEQAGGKISAESAMNTGTTIRFTVPAERSNK